MRNCKILARSTAYLVLVQVNDDNSGLWGCHEQLGAVSAEGQGSCSGQFVGQALPRQCNCFRSLSHHKYQQIRAHNLIPHCDSAWPPSCSKHSYMSWQRQSNIATYFLQGCMRTRATISSFDSRTEERN